jgi:DNA-directed RNA polymerase I subunit RPA49
MKERKISQHKVCLDFSFRQRKSTQLSTWPEKLEESANAARLIPEYNADAERPEDIYPLHHIIPEPEWAALDGLLHKLKNASNDHSRARILPNARSDWLRQNLMLAYSVPKPKSKVAFVSLTPQFIYLFLAHGLR